MESGRSVELDRDPVETRKNFYDLFRQNLESSRSYPLIIFHGKHVSYYSMLSMVDSMAESLRKSLSVGKGDKVGIALPLSPQFFISFLALQKIGAVAVPLDQGLTTHELGNILKIVDIKVLICNYYTGLEIGPDTSIENVVLARIQEFLPFEKAVAATARHIGHTPWGISEKVSITRFSELIYNVKGDQVETDPESDPSLILISPSRTGNLQAMTFTASNLVAASLAITRSIPPQKTRFRIASLLPPFVPASFLASVALPLYMGGTVTTVLERRNYYKLFFLCSLYDCDYIMASSYDLHNILATGLPNLAIRSLKGILCSSYLFTPSMRERLEKKYGTRVIEYYGIPEMLGITHMQSGDRSRIREGSPGKTISGVEAKVLEEKTHAEIPEGSTGELFLKGEQFCREYFPDESRDQDFLEDGFFDSGDLARKDEDGLYFIEDRRREAILSEGITVSSGEIEDAIAGIEGVSEVAVVGIRSERGEEDILAVVSARGDPAGLSQKIMRRCREVLAPYKVPDRIEFREELPKSMSGRILKRQIIEEHQ